MATKHGYRATSYAKMLFEAAFASRVATQPDRDLGATVLLNAARIDPEAIARAVRLSEATVVQIIDAWRRERLAA